MQVTRWSRDARAPSPRGMRLPVQAAAVARRIAVLGKQRLPAHLLRADSTPFNKNPVVRKEIGRRLNWNPFEEPDASELKARTGARSDGAAGRRMARATR